MAARCRHSQLCQSVHRCRPVVFVRSGLDPFRRRAAWCWWRSGLRVCRLLLCLSCQIKDPAGSGSRTVRTTAACCHIPLYSQSALKRRHEIYLYRYSIFHSLCVMMCFILKLWIRHIKPDSVSQDHGAVCCNGGRARARISPRPPMYPTSFFLY